MKLRLTMFVIGLVLALSACSGPGDTAAPAQETPIEPTAASSATPTATPEPTYTPVPPTATLSPTPLPTVVVYEPISEINAGQLAKIGEPFEGVLYNYYNAYIATVFAPQWLRVLFRPDAVWVAEVEEWHKIRIRNFESGDQVALFPNDDLKQIDLLAASADGRYLAAASGGGRVLRLWDMDSLKQISELPLHGYERMMAGSFSSDNRYLALAGCTLFGTGEVCLRSKVVIYDLSSGEVIEDLDGYQSPTRAVAFITGTYLLAMTGDGEPIRDAGLLVWDLKKHQRKAEFSGGRDAAYGQVSISSDGGILAAGGMALHFGILKAGKIWAG